LSVSSYCAAQHLSLGIAAFMRRLYESIMTWGRARVSTIQAVIFGMMLSWTPCVLLMAYLLWQAPLEPD
jgi:hypothetical protein